MDDPIFGYALSFSECCGWGYHTTMSDWPLQEGETFYATYESFPQAALDFFAAQS